ncbi:hypothetical protein JRC04_04580 [Mycolicibacterium sp. S2-37]|uniref:hypothetical protein n=1 Tax=Mycolicibacterium sp. S2-37 TaxID=2810297 RepID=UPI001A9479F4|nr:hypothetical protein [Mycolicibacterium sp. S2-37]MBO0676734.1 hypothetical protein [Mycolicibacterium sp. S2-37]
MNLVDDVVMRKWAEDILREEKHDFTEIRRVDVETRMTGCYGHFGEDDPYCYCDEESWLQISISFKVRHDKAATKYTHRRFDDASNFTRELIARTCAALS